MYYHKILRKGIIDPADILLLSSIIGCLLASRLKNYLSEEEAMERLKSSIIKKSELTVEEKLSLNKKEKLKKISKKIRKNPKLVKEFSRLKEKLQQGNLKAGKGTKYLPGSNGIYYARGATEGARIYFQYSGDNIITIIAESNKATQKEVINCLLKNY